jgi:hypothetical protein
VWLQENNPTAVELNIIIIIVRPFTLNEQSLAIIIIIIIFQLCRVLMYCMVLFIILEPRHMSVDDSAISSSDSNFIEAYRMIQIYSSPKCYYFVIMQNVLKQVCRFYI